MGRGGDVALVVSLGAIFQCRAALFEFNSTRFLRKRKASTWNWPRELDKEIPSMPPKELLRLRVGGGTCVWQQ
jgi:hypothetical protein